MAVDDLFSGAPPERPPGDPTIPLELWFAASAILTVLGPFCCTGPPGAAIALWVWTRAGDVGAQSTAGLFPARVGAAAHGLRGRAFAVMTLSLLSLMLQAVLWGKGVYQAVALALLQVVQGLVG
jgi:hypothetical protein